MYRLAWLVSLCLACIGASAQDLVCVTSADTTQALVLVGGRNNDWTYWKQQAQSAGAVRVYGWKRDTATSTMDDAASELAQELEQLHVQQITLVAHSMGGLVARAALQRAHLHNVQVRFIGAGVPWGGYWLADLVDLPFAHAIVEWLDLPMAVDIGSHSRFMKQLRQPLPSYVTFTVVESLADWEAQPASEAAVEQYRIVADQAQVTFQLSTIPHTGYNQLQLDDMDWKN